MHQEAILPLLREVLTAGGIQNPAEEIDLLAVTSGPGLMGSLLVGLMTAKGLSQAWGIPLIGVNHLEGHAVSARLGAQVAYPFLLLLVSGGHCQLLEVRGIGDMSRLGTTIDDAAGEAFDKIAKAMGLGYPGGPALEKMAEGGDGSRFDLPRALLGRKDCDFSFSGLKTAASRLAQTCETDADRADLADAVQNAIARQLAERSERAMKVYAEAHDHGLRQQSPAGETVGAQRLLFVVAGGVAANRTIRRVLEETAAKHGFDFLAPPMAYCTDNAAMIALAGAERLRLGLVSDIDTAARPRWPLDEHSALTAPTHTPGRKGAKA